MIKSIVNTTFKKKGSSVTVEVLDAIKDMGYKYATIGSITTSVFDMHIPQEKYKILDDAEDEVVKIEKLYDRGFVTEDERYNAVVNHLGTKPMTKSPTRLSIRSTRTTPST